MRRDYSSSNARALIVQLFIIGFIGVLSMSKEVIAQDAKADREGFAITSLPYHAIAGNGIGVWLSGGIVRLGLSNTIDRKYRGVGLVEAQLSANDLERARDVQDQLCQAVIEKPKADIETDPEMTFSVNCKQDGKLEHYRGQLRNLPKNIAYLAANFQQDILKKYEDEGRSIVKFDARISDVRREKDKFVVSVAFVNRGRYPVEMTTPDDWNNVWGERLDVSGFRVNGGGEWRADLAGQQLMNKGDYPVETVTTAGKSITTVTIPSGESITYKFLAIPREKVPKGKYEFDVLVYSSIDVSGLNGAGGVVNFVSDTRSTPFTFDTDFPSTPQEWKDYEERQRAMLSEHVIPSGHTVAEDGYYRLISDTGQRSRWVYEFKKGAPSYKKELIYDSKGEAFLGRPVWQWEADLARKTLCSPGEPCPREGRWVGIKFAHRSWTPDEYYLYRNSRFQAGETMPPVLGDGDSEAPYAHWKWLGV